MGNRRQSKGPKFVRLFHFVKLSQAWHDLSLAARCALLELIYRYNGINNGMIGLGVRQLSDALHCSRDTAARALRELDDSKLAVPLTGGHWKGKRATEWRLAFHRCDKTGALPIKNWPTRQVSDLEDTEVRPQGHKALKCPNNGTHNRNSSMDDPAKCPTRRTHIDIYQGDSELSSVQEKARRRAGLKPWL